MKQIKISVTFCGVPESLKPEEYINLQCTNPQCFTCCPPKWKGDMSICFYFVPASAMESLLSLMEGDAELDTRNVHFWAWIFYLPFYYRSLHWKQSLANGWASPNESSFHECFRKGWNSAKSPKNDKQVKPVWDTMAFPVAEIIIGVWDGHCWPQTCSMSKSIGQQLLWENLQLQLVRKHQLWNDLRDVQSHTTCFTRQWIRDK